MYINTRINTLIHIHFGRVRSLCRSSPPRLDYISHFAHRFYSSKQKKKRHAEKYTYFSWATLECSPLPMDFLKMVVWLFRLVVLMCESPSYSALFILSQCALPAHKIRHNSEQNFSISSKWPNFYLILRCYPVYE